ncbi:MAG: hypothetical protein HYS23_03665 [Geobacter sp.]|nr:hypothetical protein [Geobacter sp.]
MPALAAGESKTITGTFAVPVMTNGTYYVGGYADAYNWIEESNETNNALAGNQITTTRLYADMVLTSVNATPTAVKLRSTAATRQWWMCGCPRWRRASRRRSRVPSRCR